MSSLLWAKLPTERLSHHPAYGSRTGRFVKDSMIALYTDYALVLV